MVKKKMAIKITVKRAVVLGDLTAVAVIRYAAKVLKADTAQIEVACKRLKVRVAHATIATQRSRVLLGKVPYPTLTADQKAELKAALPVAVKRSA